jgi:hypothetical protein
MKLSLKKELLNINSNNFTILSKSTSKKKEINYNYSGKYNTESGDLSNLHFRNNSLCNYSLIE